MPVYVYKNLNTGETFEIEQRITEAALTTHPESGDPVKRLIQPVGIAFKGSGFYVTDSRRSGGGTGRASGGASSEGGASASEGGSADASGSGDAGAKGGAAEAKADGAPKASSSSSSKD